MLEQKHVVAVGPRTPDRRGGAASMDQLEDWSYLREHHGTDWLLAAPLRCQRPCECHLLGAVLVAGRGEQPTVDASWLQEWAWEVAHAIAHASVAVMESSLDILHVIFPPRVLASLLESACRATGQDSVAEAVRHARAQLAATPASGNGGTGVAALQPQPRTRSSAELRGGTDAGGEASGDGTPERTSEDSVATLAFGAGRASPTTPFALQSGQPLTPEDSADSVPCPGAQAPPGAQVPSALPPLPPLPPLPAGSASWSARQAAASSPRPLAKTRRQGRSAPSLLALAGSPIPSPHAAESLLREASASLASRASTASVLLHHLSLQSDLSHMLDSEACQPFSPHGSEVMGFEDLLEEDAAAHASRRPSTALDRAHSKPTEGAAGAAEAYEGAADPPAGEEAEAAGARALEDAVTGADRAVGAAARPVAAPAAAAGASLPHVHLQPSELGPQASGPSPALVGLEAEGASATPFSFSFASPGPAGLPAQDEGSLTSLPPVHTPALPMAPSSSLSRASGVTASTFTAFSATSSLLSAAVALPAAPVALPALEPPRGGCEAGPSAQAPASAAAPSAAAAPARERGRAGGGRELPATLQRWDLSFCSPPLETAFRRYLSRQLAVWDANLAPAHVLCAASVLAVLGCQGRLASWAAVHVALLSATGAAAAAPRWWAACRQGWVGAARVARALLFAGQLLGAAPAMAQECWPQGGGISLAAAALFSGASMMVLDCFRQAHGLWAVARAGACKRLACLWLLTAASSVAWSTVSARGAAAAGAGAPTPLLAAVLFQLLAGFALPTLAHYVWERRQRRAFLAALKARHDAKQRQQKHKRAACSKA
eukprot:scaffold20.g7882.t1